MWYVHFRREPAARSTRALRHELGSFETHAEIRIFTHGGRREEQKASTRHKEHPTDFRAGYFEAFASPVKAALTLSLSGVSSRHAAFFALAAGTPSMRS